MAGVQIPASEGSAVAICQCLVGFKKYCTKNQLRKKFLVRVKYLWYFYGKTEVRLKSPIFSEHFFLLQLPLETNRHLVMTTYLHPITLTGTVILKLLDPFLKTPQVKTKPVLAALGKAFNCSAYFPT